MTQGTDTTAMLTWRVLISTASGYCVHLEEDDPIALRMQASAYKMNGDIRAWARTRINETLKRANSLASQFNQNEALWSTAQGAVVEYAERLERAGYQLSSVPDATGLKIE